MLSLGLVLPSAAMLVGAAPASADGTTLYVDKKNAACSDTDAAAGTQGIPYCSIQAAALAVQAGQTVEVAYGSYSGTVTVTHSGTPGHPIVFKGDAGWENGSVLDLDTQPSADGGSGFVLQGVHDVTLRGFRYGAGAVTVKDSSDISVLHSFSAMGSFLVQGASHNVTLSGLFMYAGGSNSGVRVEGGATDTTITGNVVDSPSNFDTTGISLTDAPDSVVVANTVSQICDTGIALSGDSHGATIENNVVSGSNCQGAADGLLSISAASTTGSTVDYNLLGPTSAGDPYSWAGTTYATVAAFQAASQQGAHDLYANADLRTVGARAWEPADPSPAIDSGSADAPGEPARDVYGDLRAVQDPLVKDIDATSAPVDRGAVEAQNPYTFDFNGPATADDPADPLAYTVRAQTTSNPWKTSVTSYAFYFDGSTPTTTSAQPQATYRYPLTMAGQVAYPKVYAVLPDGEQIPTTDSEGLMDGGEYTPIATPAPLSASFPAAPASASAPQTESLKVQGNTYLASATVDPGDGTGTLAAAVPARSTTATAVHHYAEPGSYTATATVTDVYGRSTTVKQTVTVGDAFVPVRPTRLLDTRNGTGVAEGKLGARKALRLKIVGAGGLPSSGVTAVTLNVTVTGSSSGGWLAAYPDGAPVPSTSNLNFTSGQTVPNQVTVSVGSDGYVDLYNAFGTTDVVADVQGYFTDVKAAADQGYYQPLTPVRVMDTRKGTGGVPEAKIGPGGTDTLRLNLAKYPGVTAVVLNVTAADADSSGYAVVYPGNTTRPSASDLNFGKGQISPNLVTVPVAPDGTVKFTNGYGHVNLIADLEGYYTTATSAAAFVPLTPVRIFDTRSGTGVRKGAVGAASYVAVHIAGSHGVPTNALAVATNLTAALPTVDTTVTAWPAPWTKAPQTSTLNPARGTTRPNAAFIPIGSGGNVDFYNQSGRVDLVGDLAGYFGR
ncbi:right-handed parallel beta-helix repeat-containing protein [Streptacidiphilus sp. N1-10]|uniref:Right-handed parallel beta-helix repeat-containing protein n=1 Tax=Streptacidiphilus jeojiensis TaxID=3229225 RepID=A0ABV6XMK4_9ACTN